MTNTSVHPWVIADRVRFGISTVGSVEWPILRSFGQAVERLGFDSLWLSDHPVLAGSATWTHLAALAAVTQRLRLGPLVAAAPHLNPVILARAITDIDTISAGRAVLGIGSGNQMDELARMGIEPGSPSDRLAHLNATLQTIVPLLSHRPYQRPGREPISLWPPPVQRPSIPILIGGSGERTTLPLTARFGHACSLGPVSREAGAFDPTIAQTRFATLDALLRKESRPTDAVLKTGLLAALLSISPAALSAKLAAMPPHLAGLHAVLPFVESVEAMTTQLDQMIEVGIGYVIFIVMPGDEETLALLATLVRRYGALAAA